MKGIIFTEFIELVEEKFGYAMVDDIIEASDLPSGGAYTAVGTYSHTEMVKLVVGLSQRTGILVDDLLKIYGKHLLSVFLRSYPQFFENIDSAFAFLQKIDNYIHLEVQKLYPDAELPKFLIQNLNDNELEMTYQSERKMSALAEGLIEATLEHYQQASSVEKIMIEDDGSKVKFIIRKA